ncbi:MAG: adenylate/guanylate cyclase domain-containing protein [Betaproteobacteria bacterium]|nr:MAG: adenylate/guanylate cyclase domain-containing protein [Betaproteobacteria bacterium]
MLPRHYATVSVIGPSSRLEYTAVGSAVNLASRLCAEAAHSEVLVDQRTTDLVSDKGHDVQLDARGPIALKGFSQPVAHFALDA